MKGGIMKGLPADRFVVLLSFLLIISNIHGQNGILCLSEDFSDTLFPKTDWISDGVTRVTAAGSFVSAPAAVSFGTYNGSLTLPEVSYPVKVSFSLGRTTNTTIKTMIVEISTTGAAAGFIPLDSFDLLNTPSGTFQQFTTNLQGWSSYGSAWIRFRKISSTTSPWRIDDIEVYNAPPLPVNLAFFKGEYTDEPAALLQWKTMGEWNNSGFVVERSADGINFCNAGFVHGAGTILIPQWYSFTDDFPFTPVSYYRLRQMDYDGMSKLSEVISIQEHNDRMNSLSISWIQGTHDEIAVGLNNPLMEPLILEVADLNGRILLSVRSSEENKSVFLLKVKLSGGLYVLLLSGSHQRITRKFLVDF
jgi:hypothetical protein